MFKTWLFKAIPVNSLPRLVHTKCQNGQLARLKEDQAASILHSLCTSGLFTPGSLPLAGVNAALPARSLPHVVHAMHQDGRLAQLSVQDVRAIVHALRSAGFADEVLSLEGCTHNHAGLVTFCSADALDEPLFREAYEKGKATDSWQGHEVSWRVHVLCWAAARALALEGDFVECGVNRGGYSRAVAHYVGFERLPRKFWLLDTFCGIPEEMKDRAATTHFHYEECFAFVQQLFRDYPNVCLVRGKVPDTLATVTSAKVAFLSIDMNCAEPEIAAAEYFWPRLVSGAAVVLDDYGAGHWYARQRAAFDEFARQRGVPILSLPTGQGLLIKP